MEVECSKCGKVQALESGSPLLNCCDNGALIIRVLGNDGLEHTINYGQFLSYNRAGIFKNGVLNLYEEPIKEREVIASDFLLSGKFGSYVDVDGFAKFLTKNFVFKTIYTRRGEEIYTFENGIYVEGGRELIETQCEKILQEYAKSHTITEIFKKIKRLTAISKEEFENVPLNLIPFQNCIYDIRNDTTFEYSPKFYFRFKIPVNYVSGSKCPNFDGFVEQTLSPDDIPVIQEWFGFCLYRRYFIKKGMIWVGERDTGKTILLSVLIKLIGEENTSGVSLQKISGSDKFAPIGLYQKLLNAYDDLSSKDINDSGGFKISTGGGYVTAEKKFGDSFQFVNFAKHVFACNKIPPIKDLDDEAYYYRWLPLEFLNQIPEEEQDKFLIDKLTNSKELSGILNWAIKGLKRLINNGKFSYNKSVEEVKRIMDRSGSPLAGFVQDVLIEEEGRKITKENMYKIYSHWARKKKTTRMSISALGRELEKHCNYITPKRHKERYWEGAGINLESKSISDDTLDAFKKILQQNDLVVLAGKKEDKKMSKPSKSKNSNLHGNDTLDALKPIGQDNNKGKFKPKEVGGSNENVDVH